jgi:hypothetical protein
VCVCKVGPALLDNNMSTAVDPRTAVALASNNASFHIHHTHTPTSVTLKHPPTQIEPREVEIGEMRETIRAMDAELERYHKSNAGLDLTIQVRGGSAACVCVRLEV